jgi:hypothetical protein
MHSQWGCVDAPQAFGNVTTMGVRVSFQVIFNEIYCTIYVRPSISELKAQISKHIEGCV